MVTRFSDKLTYIGGGLPEFSIDFFLDSMFGDDASIVKDRVDDLLNRERGPVHKDFDLDDCIASRFDTLNMIGFKNNRGSNGNDWMYAHYGEMIPEDDHGIILPETQEIVKNMTIEEEDYAIKKFIEQEYLGENSRGLVENIEELFGDKSCTHGISTAGIEKVQEAKIRALFGVKGTNLKIDDIKIVPNSEGKIKANLLALLDKDYLPQEYSMHEDRPEWFHMYGQVLANLLQTNFTVNSMYINKHNEAIQKWSVKHSPKYTTTYP